MNDLLEEAGESAGRCLIVVYNVVRDFFRYWCPRAKPN